MTKRDERVRADFLQLVQTLILMGTHESFSGAASTLARAQQIPPAQLPDDLAAAALAFTEAASKNLPVPVWAVPPAAVIDTHWLPPDRPDDETIPACAPGLDPGLYGGHRVTRDARALTCERCRRIAAERNAAPAHRPAAPAEGGAS